MAIRRRTGQIDETYPLDTVQPDPYSRTKALGEEAAQAAAQAENWRWRLSGPRWSMGRILTVWTLRMLNRIRRGADGVG
jgi:hypothetical protein